MTTPEEILVEYFQKKKDFSFDFLKNIHEKEKFTQKMVFHEMQKLNFSDMNAFVGFYGQMSVSKQDVLIMISRLNYFLKDKMMKPEDAPVEMGMDIGYLISENWNPMVLVSLHTLIYG